MLAGAGGDSLRAALLGLGRKDEAAAEPEEPQPPKRRVQRRAVASTAGFSAEDEPDVPRNLTDDQFQDAVNAWRGMRACLARSKLRGSQRSGAMKVSFKIRSDGSVLNSEVVETTDGVAASIAPCVAKAAKRIRFPAFDGKDVDKEAKFVF